MGFIQGSVNKGHIQHSYFNQTRYVKHEQERTRITVFAQGIF